MDIREAREGEVVVLSPDGSLAGTEETSALEAKLAAVQKAAGRYLVIDCTSVGQLTSVAIRALLVTSRKLGRSQGRLVLFGMNAKVRKAFAISGFDKDFTILQTREEALERVLEPVAPSVKAARRSPASPAAPAPEAAAPAVEASAKPEPVPAAVPAPATGPAPGGSRRADSEGRASRPAEDPREALADALLDALGVRTRRPAAVGLAAARAGELEATADVLLTALGAKRR
jgi:anti-anti-sigma factor